jgi:hypothetical protein
MLNDKKNRQVILRQNESHLRGGATHNRVILFKMVWLISNQCSYGSESRQGVECVVTLLKITLCALTRLKKARFRNKFLPDSFIEYYL